MWLVSLAFLLLPLITICYHHFRNGRLRLAPGPLAFPIVGSLHLLGTLPHQSLAHLAKKYGPLMYLRLGSIPTIVVSSPSLAKEMLTTHDLVFAYRPRLEMGVRLFYDHRTVLLTQYNSMWRELRKLYIIKIFSGRMRDSFKHLREEEMSRTLQFLSLSQGVVNLSHVVSSLATSTMMRMVLSKGISQIDGHEASNLREMIVELFYLSGVIVIADFIPCLKWLDLNGYLKRMTKVHNLWDNYLNELISERKRDSQDKEKGDILDQLLAVEARDDDEGDSQGAVGFLDINSIKALVLELLSAGTDTMSTTIDWAMVELLRNPDVMHKLQNELDLRIGKTQSITMDNVVNLKYLEAIVKETFRLHPAAPLLVPHLASDNCNIGGYVIPQGARVMVNVWAIGRDESIWVRPLDFYPERFMEEEGGNNSDLDVKGKHFELIPFGAGRRGCPAMSFGISTIKFVVASLVHTFDWSFILRHEHDLDDMRESAGITTHRAKPLLVVAKSRGVPIEKL